MVARFEAMRQQRSMMWGVKAGKERKEGGNGKLVYRLPCPTVPMGAKRRSLVNKVAFKRERVSGELESKTGRSPKLPVKLSSGDGKGRG